VNISGGYLKTGRATDRVTGVKAFLRKLLTRIVFLLVGCAALATGVGLNFNAGHEILAGLLSPDSAEAIALSVARLLPMVIGLWLIYRGLQ
jgi:hypothetical protein